MQVDKSHAHVSACTCGFSPVCICFFFKLLPGMTRALHVTHAGSTSPRARLLVWLWGCVRGALCFALTSDGGLCFFPVSTAEVPQGGLPAPLQSSGPFIEYGEGEARSYKFPQHVPGGELVTLGRELSALEAFRFRPGLGRERADLQYAHRGRRFSMLWPICMEHLSPSSATPSSVKN